MARKTAVGGPVIIVLTDGDLVWGESDFDWQRTTALPGNFRGQFKQESLYIDPKWAKGSDDLSLRHSQFRAALLDLAAPLHGKAKDELDGEDVRHYRRERKLAWAAGTALVALTVSSVVVGYVAKEESESATRLLKIVLGQDRAGSYIRTVMREQENWVLAAEFSRITASADNTARVWEGGTWRNLAALRGHNDDVVQAKLSADGKTAITASYDATVRIWDASAWQTRSAKPH